MIDLRQRHITAIAEGIVMKRATMPIIASGVSCIFTNGDGDGDGGGNVAACMLRVCRPHRDLHIQEASKKTAERETKKSIAEALPQP